jgi:GNAT superfamily N-acetyltransferase
MTFEHGDPSMLILPEFTVRRAVMADVQELARVQIASWRESYRGIIDDDYLDAMSFDRHAAMWAHAVSSGAAAFLAELDGAIVGIANGGRRRRHARWCPQAGELYLLYVLKRAQSHGIGRGLFDAVQLNLAAMGHGDMTVQVLSANSACQFYERLGGVRIGSVNVEVGKQFLEETVYQWRD